MPELDQFLAENRDKFERDLCDLLRIESVSADSSRRNEVRRAAQWIVDQFRGLGLAVELVETAGHPIVYAETPAVAGAPTVLVYGHYDVQPPDPLSEWRSPPFEPTIRDGNIYARGATDDKGQMLTHIKSAEAWIRSQGKLPLQLKFLIEGEEEVGSAHLADFIAANKQRLACDCVVISDTSQFAAGQPAITYGLRGIAYYELRLSGPKQDLHSGTFGGAVTNPAGALCRMLAALVNEQGQVQVPGFYDDVEPLSPRERAEFAKLPFDEAAFMKQVGVKALSGEQGFSTLERRWARPTFDINGLWSGYQGEGAKTILPARAGAKFSFRLVPKQDPKKLTVALEKRLGELCPAGITMELIDFHGLRASSCRSIVLTWRRRKGRSNRGSAANRCSCAKAARYQWWAPFTICWESIPCYWVGGWTTTTRTAPMRNSAWRIFIAESKPVRTCGGSWGRWPEINRMSWALLDPAVQSIVQCPPRVRPRRDQQYFSR